MPARLVNIDRETPMFMPADMRDWLPPNHIVNFIIDAVAQLGLACLKYNMNGTGSRQYPPAMMLSLLIHCYATGRFSSREIEAASHSDVAVRYICGNHHPDHDTICAFRRDNRELFNECFVKVLAMASEMGCLKKVGGISVDGTKVQANASKHSAVSYKHAEDTIETLRQEVFELMEKAEKADFIPLESGLSIPDEIARREERIGKLEHARKIIEERFKEKEAEKEKEKEKEVAQGTKAGKKRKTKAGGTGDAGVDGKTPDAKDQYNFTDPESRIMKSGNGKHFEQAYNAQAAVDIEGSYLILGQNVTVNCNDKRELNPTVESVQEEIREVTVVLADTGYYSEGGVLELESNGGPTAYVAVESTGHHKTVADLEVKPHPQPPAEDAGVKEKMLHRLSTKEGKAIYKLRKETVEPVFGIIKEVIGFRRFSLRGLDKVNLEWELLTLSYNFKKLHCIMANLRILTG